MCIQPVDQLLVHPQPPEGVLGCMDVQVDESGDDQPISVIVAGDPAPCLREGFKYAGAFPVFTHHIPALHGAYLLLTFTIADLPSDRKSFHLALSLL